MAFHQIECAPAPNARSGAQVAGALSSSRVAIVHDYLNQRGGAERVVLELSEMWPQAPIYTSLYRAESTFPGFEGHDVRATVLDRLPIDRGFRNLFPLYPAAFHMLGTIDADVVLASSSGWAHMARVDPNALHIVYCHTPARWLYSDEHLTIQDARSMREGMARPALGPFRRVDRKAALRADLYIANSATVRRRIRSQYGIDAVVVPPPVDIDRFRPTPRGERLLAVSRLLPYKHVELLVRAATRAGMGLDVVGQGPLLPTLREIAGPSVTLHGGVDDDVVAELMQACSAVCVAAEEDFGLVAVEAQAAGKPVVAYGRGGSLETVDDGLTGVFFHERTEESVIAAITASECLDTSPERIAERARRFSPAAFRARLAHALEVALERKSQAPKSSGITRRTSRRVRRSRDEDRLRGSGLQPGLRTVSRSDQTAR
ncbi:MAG TPA: glycosyltransferase [Solirubrobacteraceae bacterium]|jgi:glycosyltransferase involved in cell wall biosynthesis|nr:glycosyltransferase [Solirubrobacteraceae bacterium]